MSGRLRPIRPSGRAKLARGVVQFGAAWLVGAGCASNPTPHLYLLGRPAESWSAPASLSGAPRVQVCPILVPDYLDTTELVLRSGNHELKVSSGARWGERLSIGLTAALAADLAARLPEDWVMLDPSGENAARRVFVTVTAFDVWADGHCVLAAGWTVRAGNRATVLGEGHGTFAIPAAGADPVGDAAIVAAMAEDVGRLADSMALQLGAAPEGADRLRPPGAGGP